MEAEKLVEIIGSDFYTGVPDSQLKALCDFLMVRYGIDACHHVIAANEGNCVGLAAGYHLATGKVPVVYLQNSGEGNIINPVTSLVNENVYAIPIVFIIGWRGEPGVKDEPQHIYQGKITMKLLEDMDIQTFTVDKDTTDKQAQEAMDSFRGLLAAGKCVAFVIKKGGLSYDGEAVYRNGYSMVREEVIRHIIREAGEDMIISTTGKASRELFEVREQNGQSHRHDFLTVGSMGHASSIALGVALHRSNRRVWCLDGDGAALMHMGAMPVIGSMAPANFVHVLLNNCAHESVGGMPTVADHVDFVSIARACGYQYAVSVDELSDLDVILKEVRERDGLSFMEVKVAVGSRHDLGRPTISPLENKIALMECLDKK